MSADLDALAESARNRGLKLARSRVRTPGKRRFGKVGLTDAGGKAIFGMDDKGPTAKPEEVEAYLRDLGANDWTASLGSAAATRARKKAKAKPKRADKPRPPPPVVLREAKPADAPALIRLTAELNHRLDETMFRRNLMALKRAAESPIVAVQGKDVLGFVGVHAMPTIHRDKPVGRMTILIVDEAARGRSIGRMLVAAAEEWARKRGCILLEVTSNDRFAKAHDFYRHLGYQRTSLRFAKDL